MEKEHAASVPVFIVKSPKWIFSSAFWKHASLFIYHVLHFPYHTSLQRDVNIAFANCPNMLISSVTKIFWFYRTNLLEQPVTTSSGPHATANPSETHRKALGSFCMRAGKDRKAGMRTSSGWKAVEEGYTLIGRASPFLYIRYTQFDKELLVLLLDSDLADQLSYSYMCLTHSQQLLNLCFFPTYCWLVTFRENKGEFPQVQIWLFY